MKGLQQGPRIEAQGAFPLAISPVEFDERLEHEELADAGISPHRLGFDPAQALRDREIRERVLAALEKLSEKHRSVLVLREGARSRLRVVRG